MSLAHRRLGLVCALCLALLAACDDADSGDASDTATAVDTSPADTATGDTAPTDTTIGDDTASDATAADTSDFDPTSVTVPTTPGQHVVTFQHDGQERGFLLVVSRNLQPGTPAPLAIVLHGAGQTAGSFVELHPTLLQLLDARGYVAAFPTALFNEERGKTNWDLDDAAPRADDERFVLDVVAILEASFAIDPARRYGAGFSNGGQLLHRVAGRNPEVFAAIAAIATNVGRALEPGGPLVPFATPDGPRGPVPVLMANGRQDPSIVWDGSVDMEGLAQAGVEDAIALYLEANGCDPTPVTTWPVPDEVFVETYEQGCTDGATVVLVGLERMDHLWPDPADGYGWDASSGALDFFARHTN